MKRIAVLLLCLLAMPLAALADPPGRVGRLSLIEGEVALFADPDQGWEGARLNMPLTSENSVWTEPGARAEVRFGSTAIRLGEATQLDILRLDDEAFRGHLVRGTLTVRVRYFDRGDSYVITTPEARFQLRANGRYRVDTDPGRGESLLTVFSGTARLEAAGGYLSVDTGRAVRVSGGERSRYEFESARSTSLDDWAHARDLRAEEREALRYVPPQMTGWEDLDDHGVWRQEAGYGALWFPTRIAVGWAPYRYGRWVWVRPWGWAWVDDAPWGYAPFHYGRWVHVGNRWGWYPGRHTTRPVWAPALVGWVGRPGWSVSISTGLADVVGWYPLSPYDSFQPWYSANVNYVTHVNRIVIASRRDRGDDRRGDRGEHRHDNRDRGATVVAREHFGARKPVQDVLAPVSGEVIAVQPVVAGSSVLPSRNEWRARNRPPEPTESSGAREPRLGAESPPAASPFARPVPGTFAPASKPVVVAPEAPSFPAPRESPPSRPGKPVPAEPVARQKPPEPAAGPAITSAPSPRTKPVYESPEPRTSAPSSRVKPPEDRGGVSRATRPQPAAKPVREPEKPADGADRPPRAMEKPAKPADPGSGG